MIDLEFYYNRLRNLKRPNCRFKPEQHFIVKAKPTSTKFLEGSLRSGEARVTHLSHDCLAAIIHRNDYEMEIRDQATSIGLHVGYQDGVLDYMLRKPYGKTMKQFEDDIAKGLWPDKQAFVALARSVDFPVSLKRVKTKTPTLKVKGKKQTHQSTGTIN